MNGNRSNIQAITVHITNNITYITSNIKVVLFLKLRIKVMF